jgi:hypothetical protein
MLMVWNLSLFRHLVANDFVCYEYQVAVIAENICRYTAIFPVFMNAGTSLQWLLDGIVYS